jgi:uncharacterized protein YaiL (DUF2058 family)
MGNSLKDQLLKAGLVNKSKVQQAKKQSRKKRRNQGAGAQPDGVAQAVARAQAEKEARDRELNRRREIKQAAKARKVLLKQFVEQNMLNDRSAEDPYNFVHGGSIRRLYVNPKQRKKLGAGELAIVGMAERYYLMAAETAKKVLEMASDTFVFIPQEEKPAEDDPYAGYQVPDDLMW